MTAALTGRELDLAVAEAMGIIVRARRQDEPQMYVPDFADEQGRQLTAYSAPDFSGFAAVVARLVENAQGDTPRRKTLTFSLSPSVNGEWLAGVESDEVSENQHPADWAFASGATLPEAACRLLVAWERVRKERGWK